MSMRVVHGRSKVAMKLNRVKKANSGLEADLTLTQEARDQTHEDDNAEAAQSVVAKGEGAARKKQQLTNVHAEVEANIVSSVDKIVDKLPRKWQGVQAIHLKASNSSSLPLFTALPTASTKAQAKGKDKSEGMVIYTSKQ